MPNRIRPSADLTPDQEQRARQATASYLLALSLLDDEHARGVPSDADSLRDLARALDELDALRLELWPEDETGYRIATRADDVCALVLEDPPSMEHLPCSVAGAWASTGDGMHALYPPGMRGEGGWTVEATSET